jgi:hypothetical protein
MDQVILKVLAAEVQRRRCPGCGVSLRQAEVDAGFSGHDKVQLHFRCRNCIFEGGGEIELTPEIYREAALSEGSHATRHPVTVGRAASPIEADEVLAVHEIMRGWTSDLRSLLKV